MKNQMRIAFIVACFAALTTGIDPAVANVVGVDASGSVYTGAGVLDTSSRTWTSAPNSSDTFLLAGNTVTMTYGSHFAGGGAGSAAIGIFDDYKHNGGAGTFEVVLTGLDLSTRYNIVIYGAQAFGFNRGGSFDPTAPDLAAASTTGDQQSSFAEGVNYVRFDRWSPDNSLADQRFRFVVGNGPDGIGIFNGFEIQAIRKYESVVNFDVGTQAVYSGPGVLSDSGTVWNDGDTTTSNLLDSNGGGTNIDIAIANQTAQGSIGSGNALLFDYTFDTNDDMTLTFSDLIAGRAYDLALFGAQDGFGGRGSTFSIDGHGSKTTTADYTGLDANGFEEGDTHVIFTNVIADVSGQIVVNIDQEGTNGVGFLNGAQIGLVATPSPAALPAGLLMLGLIAMRRQR